jgi:hypothetical protein
VCALSKKNEKAKEKVGVAKSPAIRAGQVAQVRVRHALATQSSHIIRQCTTPPPPVITGGM